MVRIPSGIQASARFMMPRYADTAGELTKKAIAKQWVPSARLMKHVKDIENPDRAGRNINGMWHVYTGWRGKEHRADERIGWGHQVTSYELKNGLQINEDRKSVEFGLSDSQGTHRLTEGVGHRS